MFENKMESDQTHNAQNGFPKTYYIIRQPSFVDDSLSKCMTTPFFEHQVKSRQEIIDNRFGMAGDYFAF